MITEKQKCIAEQAVYGDLLVIKSGQETEMERRLAVTLERVLVLRPLSDLTVEITHKGYNDDKPFIPLVELAKILGIKECSVDEEHKELISWGIHICDDYEIGYIGFKDGWMYSFDVYGEDYFLSSPCHFNQQAYDLLHQWHFDTRNLIESGEAIDVNTLDINPYSVKL